MAPEHDNETIISGGVLRPHPFLNCFVSDSPVVVDPAERRLSARVEQHEERAHQFFVDAEYDKALLEHDAAISLRPNQEWLHVNRALTLVRSGRIVEAIESYGAAIALKNNRDDFFVERARLKLQLGLVPEAIEDVACAVRIFLRPKNYILLARCHEKSANLGSAIDSARKALVLALCAGHAIEESRECLASLVGENIRDFPPCR